MKLHEVEPMVAEVREALRHLLRRSRASQRQVELACGWSRGYLSQVLQGRITLTLSHVLSILAVLDEPPDDFFRRLLGDPADSKFAGAGGEIDEIRERLDQYDAAFEELRSRGLIHGDPSRGKVGQR